MRFVNSTRLAWGVATLALALWATNAPVTLGQVSQLATDAGLVPVSDEPAVPCAPPPLVVTPGAETTFHICGPDPALAQAIQDVIGGHGFSVTLRSTGDGCADLTVKPSASTFGSASSVVSVGLGDGRQLHIEIVSEQGATSASIDVR
jgi:hypothetical protein